MMEAESYPKSWNKDLAFAKPCYISYALSSPRISWSNSPVASRPGPLGRPLGILLLWMNPGTARGVQEKFQLKFYIYMLLHLSEEFENTKRNFHPCVQGIMFTNRISKYSTIQYIESVWIFINRLLDEEFGFVIKCYSLPLGRIKMHLRKNGWDLIS